MKYIVIAVVLAGTTLSATAARRSFTHHAVTTESTAVADTGPLVCTALVLSVESTGIGLNDHDFAKMTLRVTPPRGRSFVAIRYGELSNPNPPRRGSTMRVTCDPSNPGEIHPIS